MHTSKDDDAMPRKAHPAHLSLVNADEPEQWNVSIAGRDADPAYATGTGGRTSSRLWAHLPAQRFRRGDPDKKKDDGNDDGQRIPPTMPISTNVRHRRRKRRSDTARWNILSTLPGMVSSILANSADTMVVGIVMAVGMCAVLLVLLLVSFVQHYYIPWVLTRPSRRPFVMMPRDNQQHDGLPWYRPAEVAPGVGDSSPRYSQVRHSMDQQLPLNERRTASRVHQLLASSSIASSSSHRVSSTGPSSYLALTDSGRQLAPQWSASIAYDVRNCPAVPPPGYPFEWNLLRILDNWNVDDIVNVPNFIHQSICAFDYHTDRDKILAYRDAEVPFVVDNDPEVWRTVERWNVPNYMEVLLGSHRYGGEMSHSNHFLYYHDVKGAESNVTTIPANRIVEMKDGMTYREWRDRAEDTGQTYARRDIVNDRPHYSLRLSAFGANPMKQQLRRRKRNEGGSSTLHEPLAEYLFDELPFFQPRINSGHDNANINQYLVNASAQHGIYCRFGMAGTVAEAHFDLGRNAVVILRGHRRYILNRPEQCHNLALFPKHHPSGRHSRINWSNPHDGIAQHPEFGEATGSEVIVRAGQVLWLPSLYFHTIVSLDTTIQCNTRSGDPPTATETFRRCGF